MSRSRKKRAIIKTRKSRRQKLWQRFSNKSMRQKARLLLKSNPDKVDEVTDKMISNYFSPQDDYIDYEVAFSGEEDMIEKAKRK